MKYGQLFNAYGTLNKMLDMQFPIRDAYRIFRLVKELEDAYQFGVQCEQKLIHKYDGVVSEIGIVSFVHSDTEEDVRVGTEKMNAYKKEMNEFLNMDVECEYDPITLNYDAFGEQTITPKEIMSLDGVVIFK